MKLPSEPSDIVKSGYADATEVAQAAERLQSLPEKTLATASSLLGDLPASLLPIVIAKSTARRGKGGRQPAADPRLDPNMDPKRAKRILANRQSAARSKLKQKLLTEGLKARQQVLSLQQKQAANRKRQQKKQAAAVAAAAAAAAATAASSPTEKAEEGHEETAAKKPRTSPRAPAKQEQPSSGADATPAAASAAAAAAAADGSAPWEHPAGAPRPPPAERQSNPGCSANAAAAAHGELQRAPQGPWLPPCGGAGQAMGWAQAAPCASSDASNTGALLAHHQGPQQQHHHHHHHQQHHHQQQPDMQQLQQQLQQLQQQQAFGGLPQFPCNTGSYNAASAAAPPSSAASAPAAAFWPSVAAAAAQFGASGAALPGGACYYGANSFEAAFFETLHAQMQMHPQFMMMHQAMAAQAQAHAQAQAWAPQQQQNQEQQQQQQQQQLPGAFPGQMAPGVPEWLAAGGGAPLWRNRSMGSCNSLSAASTSVLQPLPGSTNSLPLAQHVPAAPAPAPPQPWYSTPQMQPRHTPAAAPPPLPPQRPSGANCAGGAAAAPGAAGDAGDDGERLELPPNEFGAMMGGSVDDFCCRCDDGMLIDLDGGSGCGGGVGADEDYLWASA